MVAKNQVDSPALECIGLVKQFNSVLAVSNFSVSIPRCNILALLGPSGCGKTTALRLISGFEHPDAGSIAIGGQIVNDQSHTTPPEKRRVGMVFQESALFPHLSVEENIAYGLLKDSNRKQRTSEILDLIGLNQQRNRMPHELSGGQQQRVALGRALAPQPHILLLDEPFSNLDSKLREQVRRDVVNILKATGITAIFVTHDQEEALYVGDTIAIMNQGAIEQIGSPKDIFHRPITKFVAQFIGMVDFLPAKPCKGGLDTEIGFIPCSGQASNRLDIISKDRKDLVELMIRPDCLECAPVDRGSDVIIGREFRGAFYLYKIELSSGRIVRCLLPHTAEYDIGTNVMVTIREGHYPQAFIDERPIDLNSIEKAVMY